MVTVLRTQPRLLLLLAVLVPMSVLAKQLDWPEEWLFFNAIAAIIPLAILLSTATERLAEGLGASIGALLNAVFANATELIIGLVALRAGLIDIVKASITGSVMANLLLALGLSMFVGGVDRQQQEFSPAIARVNGTAMTLAVLSILIPSLSGLNRIGFTVEQEATLPFSSFVAWVLLLVYGFTLVFSLSTHRSLYVAAAVPEATQDEVQTKSEIPIWVLTLIAATVAIAYESELFVHVVESVTRRWGLSDVFTGVILLPLLGGAAEYVTSVSMARRNKMDLAVSVVLSSTLLIALLVVPVLVLAGPLLGHALDLNFGIYEVVAVTFSVVVCNLATTDGQSNWLEGVLLLAAYVILAAGFFYQVSPS